MTDIYKAAQMALEALVDAQNHNYSLKHKEADQLVKTLRAALAEQHDYKAWYAEAMCASNEAGFVGLDAAETIRQLAAAPQPRRRLAREEIEDAVREADLDWHQGWTLDEDVPNRYETLCRAIEAAVWGEQT